MKFSLLEDSSYGSLEFWASYSSTQFLLVAVNYEQSTGFRYLELSYQLSKQSGANRARCLFTYNVPYVFELTMQTGTYSVKGALIDEYDNVVCMASLPLSNSANYVKINSDLFNLVASMSNLTFNSSISSGSRSMKQTLSNITVSAAVTSLGIFYRNSTVEAVVQTMESNVNYIIFVVIISVLFGLVALTSIALGVFVYVRFKKLRTVKVVNLSTEKPK
ncbi:hypothetical protein AKO1_008325 [Acrasis kona]|uniref:Uncharacterized protein n=1 Tax=Acrasis kona TaxID=1008807 RepID=A0AAW2YP89_9EUKA